MTIFIFGFLLLIGSLLILHPLFPINNLSLTWVGILKYLFEFLFYNKIYYSREFFTGSLVFFDEGGCGQLTKEEQDGICGGVDNVRSIIGYWLNDNIIVDNTSRAQNYDYVISKNKLDLPLIKESDNGIYIYKIK